MAKLTDHDKELLVADYHTNKFSQRELSKKYNTSIGTVNNLTKSITPKNEHLVNAQITLLTAKGLLPPEQLNAILSAAQEEVYNKAIITNATQLNVVRITEHLSNNKKLEKINIGDGVQNFEEVGLGASDYQAAQNAIHKAGQTLGVIEQFAPKQEINNTNAVQNNTENTVVFKRITSAGDN